MNGHLKIVATRHTRTLTCTRSCAYTTTTTTTDTPWLARDDQAIAVAKMRPSGRVVEQGLPVIVVLLPLRELELVGTFSFASGARQAKHERLG